MSDEFQQEIDNILAENGTVKKKKKKNSGDKGSRAERELCKKLSERFGKPFERSVGSGARVSQVKAMTEAAKQTLLGDISIPDGFAWVLESKCGYEDKVDFHNIWTQGNKTFDSFIEQVTTDSVKAGRKPMLFYKRNLRPWLVFFRKEDRPHVDGCIVRPVEFDYSLVYREWMGVSLDVLLEMQDLRSPDMKDFWFK